jgi:hypothetical protein
VIESALWCTLVTDVTKPGAVDCDNVGLRKPSPAELIAVTSNLYKRPACRPFTSTDSVDPLYVPTFVDTAEPSVPALRYSV